MLERVVRSLALARSREGFVDGPPLAVPPLADREALAREAAAFFSLPERVAQELPNLPEIGQWGAAIHGAMAESGRWSCTFSTSGSTGLPCPHTHTLAELEEEAGALAPFFAGRRRVVSVMPLRHVYGFAFALMLPRALDIPVRELPPLPSVEFFRELRAGDLVLAFPVFWRAVLDLCSGPRPMLCPPDVQGVTSAAPCPPEVIEGLLDPARPILSGFTEIYGATEFGAVGLRRQRRGAYALLPHWRRVLLEDRSFGISRAHGPAMPLPDEMDWRGERLFVPTRRKDLAVQVGGVNVFPARVAALLREHPRVADCAVRLMRPEEGARLKAFVTPRGTELPDAALARELKLWVARRLEPASRPKSYTFGQSLPTTPSGKLTDWNISSKP
jgi:4-coumarate--CoA ligase (photoactive yellow protein activation family)